MIMTNKLLPVALIAALVGGSVGALVMHKSQPATAETTIASAQETATDCAPVRLNRFRNNEMVPASSTQQASRRLIRQVSRTDSLQHAQS